jgi:hypothetical protein
VTKCNEVFSGDHLHRYGKNTRRFGYFLFLHREGLTGLSVADNAGKYSLWNVGFLFRIDAACRSRFHCRNIMVERHHVISNVRCSWSQNDEIRKWEWRFGGNFPHHIHRSSYFLTSHAYLSTVSLKRVL